jgi:hypothetical protein
LKVLKFLISRVDGFDGPFSGTVRGAQPALATLSSLPRCGGEDGLPADLRQHKSASGKLWVANLRPRGPPDESGYMPSPAESAVSPWLLALCGCRGPLLKPIGTSNLNRQPRPQNLPLVCVTRRAKGLPCEPASDFQGGVSRKYRAGRGHHELTGDPSSRTGRQDQEPGSV